MTTPPVPPRYRGIWRRTLLDTADGRDTTSTVLWLQAAHWHADLRIPAGRPGFEDVTSLDACSGAQRAWLATQQGFAGITSVRARSEGDICHWRRLFDLQPPQGVPDEGRMRFEPDLLVETGLHAAYLEHWRRLPQSAGPMAVLGLLDSGDRMAAKQMLFLAGPYVMHLSWPRSSTVAGARLDAALSFGNRRAHGYTILASTQPWLEGVERRVRFVGRAGATVGLLCDGQLQTWNVLEGDPACCLAQ